MLIDEVKKYIIQHCNFTGPIFKTNKTLIERLYRVCLILMSWTPIHKIVTDLVVKHQRSIELSPYRPRLISLVTKSYFSYPL